MIHLRSLKRILILSLLPILAGLSILYFGNILNESNLLYYIVFFLFFCVSSFGLLKYKQHYDLFSPSIGFPIIFFLLYGIGSIYLLKKGDLYYFGVLFYPFIGIIGYQLGVLFVRININLHRNIKIYLDWNKTKLSFFLVAIALISFLSAGYVYYKIGVPILADDIFHVRITKFYDVSHYSLFLLRNIGIVFHFYFILHFTNKYGDKSYNLKKITLYFLVAFLMLLSTAGRADILMLILPLIIFSNYIIKRLNVYKAFFMAFSIIVALAFYNFIRLYSTISEHETLAFWHSIYGDNMIMIYLNHFFAQIALCGICLRSVIKNIPYTLDYFKGSLIPQTLSTFLPGHQDTPGEILKTATDMKFTGGQVNFTLIGDFYSDFGLVGVFLGMLFLGIFVKVAYRYFLKEKSATSLIIYGYTYYSIIVGIPGGLFSQAIRYYYLIIILLVCLLSKLGNHSTSSRNSKLISDRAEI